MEDISRPSVDGVVKKTMDYAMRPPIEFNKYEALDLLENLQNAARDTKHDKQEYYRLAYRTARSKINLPAESFRSLTLRLLGDKDHQKVFEAVAKVEKPLLKASSSGRTSFPPYSSSTWGPRLYRTRGRARPSTSTCYYCHQPGHRIARCFLRMSHSPSSSTPPQSTSKPSK